MGHVTITGKTLEEVKSTAAQVKNLVHIIA
jgi:hypothetical protein